MKTNFDISIDRFDEFATEYDERFQNMSAYADSIARFCDLISPDNPKILELACGPGNVTQMLRNRFPESKITAIDLAPKMIEIAHSRLPDVDFRLMDVRNISDLPEKFDAVMCSFCLPFLSKNDAAKLMSDCAKLLTEYGVLYISTMEGDENKAGFETTNFSGNSKIYFNYHRQAELETDLKNAGFEKVKVKRQNYIEPDGSATIDLIFIAVKS